jgi:hypothetical protein
MPAVDERAEQSAEGGGGEQVNLAGGLNYNVASRVSDRQVERDVIAGPPRIDSRWPLHGQAFQNIRPMIDRGPSLSKVCQFYHRHRAEHCVNLQVLSSVDEPR